MPDLESRVAVANHCRESFPLVEVINNGWLVMKRDDIEPPPMIVTHLKWDAVRAFKQTDHIVKHPDIILHEGHGSIAVIEIDGSVHEEKTEATEARNAEYSRRHIPLLVLLDEDITTAPRWEKAGHGWRATGTGWKAAVEEFVDRSFVGCNPA